MRSALSTLLLLALAVAAAAVEDSATEFELNMQRACADADAKNLEDNESPAVNENGISKKHLRMAICLFRGYNVFNENNNGFNESNFRRFLQRKFTDISLVEEMSDTCSKKVESSDISDIEERTDLLLTCLVEVQNKTLIAKTSLMT